MKRTTKEMKELALKNIVVSMEEITVNLKTSALIEDVKANSQSLKILAEAFKTVSSIK